MFKKNSHYSFLLFTFICLSVTNLCLADALETQRDLIISYIEQNKVADAEAAVEELIADHSNHPDIVSTLKIIADMYWSKEKRSESNRLNQTILDRWPEHEDVMTIRADLAGGYIANHEFAKAKTAVEQLLAGYSNHPEIDGVSTLSELATWYWNEGEQSESNKLKEAIIVRWPEHEDAFLINIELINGYIRNNEDAKAEAAIENLIEAGNYDPNIIQPDINQLITDYSGHSDLTEAVFTIARRYYDNAFLQESEGNEAQSKDCFQKAIDIWERVKNELPQSSKPWINPEIYLLSAHSHYRLGQYEQAVTKFQQMIDGWPDFEQVPNALLHIGRCYERLKRTGVISKSEADIAMKTVYQQLIQAHPNSDAANIANNWLNSNIY